MGDAEWVIRGGSFSDGSMRRILFLAELAAHSISTLLTHYSTSLSRNENPYLLRKKNTYTSRVDESFSNCCVIIYHE